MNKLKQIIKTKWALAFAGFIAGIVLILGVRVAAYSPPKGVHYHANFAVYINGQREMFRPMNYYEEEAVVSCAVTNAGEADTTPMSRVHMHGGVNNVVHVEDSRVTWGNFFTVLDWNVGSNYIATRDNLYQNSDTDKISYVLNGKTVDNVANLTIGDQDKLLVNYGNQTAGQITSEYNQIKNNALLADSSKDPASCGGGHAAGVTMSERMHHMF